MRAIEWLKEFPCVREQFEASGGFHTESSSRELLRFFQLTQLTDKPLAMVNKNIDLLWHTFIEFTELYFAFCHRTYGEIIHHRPRTSTFDVPQVAIPNFYNLYESTFGPVSEAWELETPEAISKFGRGEIQQLPRELRWSGWPGRHIQN